jgi:hypothetical protein
VLHRRPWDPSPSPRLWVKDPEAPAVGQTRRCPRLLGTVESGRRQAVPTGPFGAIR